jgi:uncharacterized membrane protein
MKRLHQAFTVLAAALGATLGTAALATPAIQQQFQGIGKPAAGTALAQAQCTTCHTSPPKLNPFGLDVKAAMAKQGNKSFTAAPWKVLGPIDSDKDGASNQAEIQAGTLPGDATSKPAATASAAPPGSPTPPEKRETEFSRALHPVNAFHPIMVHFPIALFFVSLALDLLGMVRKDPALHVAGFYNLAFALLSALASLVTGYIAFLRLHFPFEGVPKNHIVLALCTTVLMAVLYAIRVRRHEKMGTGARVLYLIVGMIGVVTLALVGHYGGEMVYGS